MNIIQIVVSTLNSGKKFFLRNKPRIFMITGMGLNLTGTVTACSATYKHFDEIMDDSKYEMLEAECSENPGKNKAKVIAKTVGKMAKNYALPAGLIIAGNGCIGYADHVHAVRETKLSDEVAAIGASYYALRKKMEEKLGKEEADKIRLGVSDVKETIETEKDGKKKKEKVERQEIDKDTALDASPYAVFFDHTTSTCASNTGDPEIDLEYNSSFVKLAIGECQYLLDNNLETEITMPFIFSKLGLSITDGIVTAGFVKGDTIEVNIVEASKWASAKTQKYLTDCLLLEFNCRPDIRPFLPKSSTKADMLDKI